MRQTGVPFLRGQSSKNITGRNWLRWLNLRPEEGERTFLMFAFYTFTSVGILWLEVSVATLFLGEYGAESLPWIYIASAAIGTGFGFIYSWLQKLLPLRHVIVLTSVLIALPLLLFRLGLSPALLGGYIIFLMRLWLEAIYVVNEINTSITANQLFTIREIKRTYPLISSGILAADVVSGFSLPILRELIGLSNVILMACLMLLAGAAVLFYLTRAYHQFFPDPSRRSLQEKQPDFTARQLQGPLRRYVKLVVVFFVMVQVLALLLDFQYLSQLEQNVSIEKIADFLALFSAILGTVELMTQWFVSGRVIERVGVFVVVMLPPILIICFSTLSLVGLLSLFLGTIALKFVDELLRYTLVASTAPVLFQPLPEAERSRIQSDVRGIAEPLSTGLTGIGMLLTIWLIQQMFGTQSQTFQWVQSLVFLFYTALFALLWLLGVLGLRSKYLEVLVLSAERKQLSLSEADLQVFKRDIMEALSRPSSDADKESYIELLIQNDPKKAGKLLSPLLPTLAPGLQRQSLEMMLNYPDPAYLDQVQQLIEQPLAPDVLAAALRYIWLLQPEPDLSQLRPYLKSEIDPAVRGTAASLMLRLGDPRQKAEATDTLRRMLSHKQEQERIMGCRALGGAVYLQSLRLQIKPLLQDKSLRVRCSLLEAIAATHLEEYYPALLRGLQYKSTREAAKRALVRLENDAIPLLLRLAENRSKAEGIRTQAWSTLGQIGTPDALNVLVSRLTTSWGATRRTLLRVLLKLPQEAGIEAVADGLGRSGIETLINQELQFLAHIYASLLDLDLLDLEVKRGPGEEVTLLRRALSDSETDSIERLFLLMRFLYDSNKIQAGAFNLQSDSRESVARGLEILDNTIDISKKQVLLNILDRLSVSEKLHNLAEFGDYQPMKPSQRLHYLLELRHFLSDWVVACCFHLARRARWNLLPEQSLACLQSPTGFVREAVLAYLSVASPKALPKLLPRLSADPDPLVSAQVHQMMAELGLSPPTTPA